MIRKLVIAMAVFLIATVAIMKMASAPLTRMARPERGAEIERAKNLRMALPGRLPTVSRELTAPTGRTPLEVAKNFLEKNRESLRLQEHHRLVPEVHRTPLRTVVRYQIYEGDLPLVGMRIQLRLDGELTVNDVRSTYRPLRPADTSLLGFVDAADAASRMSRRYEVPEGQDLSALTPILFATANVDRPELSFVIPVRERGAGNEHRIKSVVVRAEDGQILATSRARRELDVR